MSRANPLQESTATSLPVGRRLFLFNTVCEIILYEYGEAPGPVLDECERIARSVQEMLNFYSDSSQLSRLNREYRPGKPYPLSAPFFALLGELVSFSRLTGGAYDCTVGRLTRTWRFTGPHPTAPGQEDIRSALEKTGYQHLHLDHRHHTITIDIPGVLLDLGGAGKGYALGMVVDFLRSRQIFSASVNFGGNLYVLGHSPGCHRDGLWQVGVQRPWSKRGDSVGSILLRDAAVATSGGYDRFFADDGKVYHHLLNPLTGQPVANDLLGVSILCENPMMTDLVSTAFFVLGRKAGAGLIDRLRERFAIEYLAVTVKEICGSLLETGQFQPVSTL